MTDRRSGPLDGMQHAIDFAERPDQPRTDFAAHILRHRHGGRTHERADGKSRLADQFHAGLIERRHRLSIAREVMPGFEPTDLPVAPSGQGGVKGKRLSKKDKLRRAGLR